MTTIKKLTVVFDNRLAGDRHERVERDRSGNLYLTNNAETRGRLTGMEWAAWSADAVRGAIDDCVRAYGKDVGLNVASQCGGYEYMTEEQQQVVDAWNRLYGRAGY